MTPRDRLLEELLVERHNGGGWETPEPWTRRGDPVAIEEDDEVTCKRRVRELLEATKHAVIEPEEGGLMWGSTQ